MYNKKFSRSIAIILILALSWVSLIPNYVFAENNQTNNSEISDNVSGILSDGDPKVKEAQEWLNETYGSYASFKPLEVDGKTGYSTVYNLIVALQIEIGLASSANGTFGPKTTSLTPTISKTAPGTNSNIIRILQHGLFCKGYGAYDDYGTYGDKTDEAIKQLQSDAGLDPTGIVTPMIFKAVLNTDALVINTYYGDAKVRYVQQRLNNLYSEYFGIMPCDGIYARSTNKALIYAVQAEENLTPSLIDGIFGLTTMNLFTTLNQNSSNENMIRLMQFAMYCNGYDVSYGLNDLSCFNGIYNLAMETRVKEFQEFMCLNVTGKIDSGTMASLLSSKGDTTRSADACDTSTRLDSAKISSIKNAGYSMVGRYLTNAKTGTLDKKMTTTEIDLIIDSDLSIIPIYQTYGGDVDYYTQTQGVEDAKSAEEAARKFGIPEGSTIYFAVDYDAYDFQVTEAIIPYFQKISETMDSLNGGYSGVYKVGIYAPRNVCNRVYKAGYIENSYVSDASTGYSGNLGYTMPEKWAFDQYCVDINVGSGNGLVGIDKVAYSKREQGVSYVEKDLKDLTEAYFATKYCLDLMGKNATGSGSSWDEDKQTIFYASYILLENRLIKENSEITKYLSNLILDGGTPNINKYFDIIDYLSSINSTTKKYCDKWETQYQNQAISTAANLIPVVGDIKNFAEAFTGEEIGTNRKLAWWERVLGFVCGLDTVVASASILTISLKEARVASKVLDLELTAGRITLNQYNSINGFKEIMFDDCDAIYSVVKSITKDGDNYKIVDIAGEEFTLSRTQLKNELIFNGYADNIAERMLVSFETGCFTGDTLVDTTDGLKRIDEIEIGDFVLSKNVETGDTDYKEVLNTYEKSTNEFIYLYTDDEVIETTKNHLFFVDDWWQTAEKIDVGDKVLTSEENYKEIEKIEVKLLNEPEKIYNLNVDEYHTYFVGEEKLLVHNMCTPTMTDWFRNLTETEFNALRKYQGDDIYEALNSGLRNGNVPENLQYLVPEIDSAISKGVLSEAETLYRGFTTPEIISNWDEIVRTQNFRFTDDAFVSTSTKESVAEMFAMGQGDEGIFATVKTKAGTNVAFMNTISDLVDEGEILLGRGHVFKITKAWEEDGMKYIIMEVE
jgi:peptidoglycan hydrolase-like protein with peptidoglycan-binding domain